MLNISRDELIIVGVIGGLILYSTTNGASIGKVTDSSNIRPRSRVDTHNTNISLPNVRKYHPSHKQPNSNHKWNKYSLSPNAAVDFFKLYSIEFGNWVTQNERVNYLYGITESLKNMASVIPLMSNHKIGFNRRLSITIGSRGYGGSGVAFYQGVPLFLINLTRHNGPGSFGHEWGHALDHYLGYKYLSNPSTFVSSGSVSDSIRKRVDLDKLNNGTKIERLFEELFSIILWKEKLVPTEYHLYLLRQPRYFNKRVELFARVIEGFFSFKFKLQGIKDYMTITPWTDPDIPPPHLIRKVIPTINRILEMEFKYFYQEQLIYCL